MLRISVHLAVCMHRLCASSPVVSRIRTEGVNHCPNKMPTRCTSTISQTITMAKITRDSRTITLAITTAVAQWESIALQRFASHRKHTTLIIPFTVVTHPIKGQMVFRFGRSLMSLMYIFQDNSGHRLLSQACLIMRLVRNPQL